MEMFYDDPDDDRPLSSLWTVLAWMLGAAGCLAAAGWTLRKIDKESR